MKRFALALSGILVLGVVGCGSKSEDDGLKLESKEKPPIEQPASGAVPPEVAAGKKSEGEGK